MTKPSKFAHVVFRTAGFHDMLAWWSTVLEAEVRFENPMLAFLSYDDEHHRVAIINMPGLADADAGRVGVDHIAYTYRSLDDLLANYRRLRGGAIEPYWTIHHGGTLSSYYRDPDGNQVELQVDAMTPSEADDFMRSPAFAANPIGVPVDFEDLVTHAEAGEPNHSLLAYPPATVV